MRLTNLALAAVLGLGLVTGCDDDKKTGDPAPTPGGDAAKTVTDAAKDASKTVTDAAKDATKTVTDAAADLQKKADAFTKDYPQLEPIIKALKENKTEVADTTLKGLETAKATLPEKLQALLPKLRKVVDEVKGGKKFEMSMLSDLWK